MIDLAESFSDSDHVAKYEDGVTRFVPGLADLHRMTSILLTERAPADAKVLVLGAGGGLELKALAQAHPGWTFDGVDPSRKMLKLAEQTLGPLMSRVNLHEGYISDAPERRFDAGACMLTLHFLDAEERLQTLVDMRRRLNEGAPFVSAHSSFPQSTDDRSIWISRYAAFAVAAGADPEDVEGARAGVETQLAVLEPEQDEEILREAGFTGVSLFYAAFSWRGWVAYV